MADLADGLCILALQGLFEVRHMLAEGGDETGHHRVDLLQRQIELRGKVVTDVLNLGVGYHSLVPLVKGRFP